MTERIWKWIGQERLIEAGDLVIAGVSGGADSVYLLLCLLEYQKKMDFTVRVVHVEHGIRGEESLEDARFVGELCETCGVCCQVYRVDVPRYAGEQGQGLEEAARALRYACYGREAVRCARQGLQGRGRIRIALAHHADDNAETVLFQMIRGSGIRGLGGMRAKRPFAERGAEGVVTAGVPADRCVCADLAVGGPADLGAEGLSPEEEKILADVTIVRPLLCCRRGEIEAALAARGQKFRQDSTNFATDCSRNCLRHCVMPELEKINDRAVFHMAESAARLREAAAYLDGQVKEAALRVCLAGEEGVLLKEAELVRYPPFLQRELLHRVLEDTAGSGKDIGRVHVEALAGLFALQTGRRLSLPHRLCAERVYEGVYLKSCGEQREGAVVKGAPGGYGTNGPDRPGENRAVYEVTPELLSLAERGGAVISLPDGEIRLRIFLFRGKMDEIPKKKYTKWLSYDKMKCGLQIRNRKAGDFLLIDEEGHRKKLKKYFVEEKVPGDKRDGIWLVADGAHIAWVVGGRISAGCKVAEHTGKILEIQFTGGSYHEDQKD